MEGGQSLGTTESRKGPTRSVFSPFSLGGVGVGEGFCKRGVTLQTGQQFRKGKARHPLCTVSESRLQLRHCFRCDLVLVALPCSFLSESSNRGPSGSEFKWTASNLQMTVPSNVSASLRRSTHRAFNDLFFLCVGHVEIGCTTCCSLTDGTRVGQALLCPCGGSCCFETCYSIRHSNRH